VTDTNGVLEPYAFVFHSLLFGLRVDVVDRVQQPNFEAGLDCGELQI
jgi:hypothetical protein